MIYATIIGIALIAALGFFGRSKSLNSHTGWSIGNRTMSTVTTFFLQAGAIFTSFTFLGMSGLTVLGGVSAAYMPSYLIIGYIGMFLIGPLIWKLGKTFGYRTNADLIGHRFHSRALGRAVAVIAVVFFMPIVQVQIVGLGTMVSFATGRPHAGTISMVVATLLILGFVSWSGIKGVATTAYFKDVAMIVALAVILAGVLFADHGAGFMASVLDKAPNLLQIHPGTKAYGMVWYISSVIISGIGLGGMTLPESWPAVLSAEKSKAVSRNHVLLPLYTLGTFIPIILGFFAVRQGVVETGAENSAILTLARNSLPGWLMGFVLISGIACAIVPAGHCVLSIATLISTNLVPERTAEHTKLSVGRISAAVILLLSLILSLLRPDLMANLYLLTYSGLAQVAPGNILAVTKQRFITAKGLAAGLLVGELIVIVFTVFGFSLWGVNTGLVGLGANLLVAVLVSLVTVRERDIPAVPALAQGERA
ncbi:MAG: sodium:solute symporter family protein [Bifidobacterium psychraerophilum]